jgi:hypothetical protein
MTKLVVNDYKTKNVQIPYVAQPSSCLGSPPQLCKPRVVGPEAVVVLKLTDVNTTPNSIQAILLEMGLPGNFIFHARSRKWQFHHMSEHLVISAVWKCPRRMYFLGS